MTAVDTPPQTAAAGTRAARPAARNPHSPPGSAAGPGGADSSPAAPPGAPLLRTGSLCTGYGGLDMAVQEVLGGELAWVADNDPGAAAILAHRYPAVPNLHDLTAQDWANAEPVDILTAGFPCQPVSLAGKRLGEADERWIWPDVARAVRDLRPGLVVLENVAALVARGLAGVSADLAAIGYVGSWRCIRASDVGAPHGRNRVFIAAWPASDTERHSGPRLADSPERSADRRVATDRNRTGAREGRIAQDTDRAVGGERWLTAPGQAPGGWPRADLGGPGGAPIAADTQGDGRHQGRPESAGLVGRPDAALGRDESCPSCGCAVYYHDAGGYCAGPCGGNCADPELGRPDGGWNSFEDDADPAEVRAYALAHSDGSGWRPEQRPARRGRSGGLRAPGREPGDSPGGSALGEVLRILDWGAYAPAIARWEAILGRPAPRPTEPGRTGERLSPRFVEWLMGLPDGWVTDVPGLTRNAHLKALGNGVVPQQAAAALRLLLPAVSERAA